MNKKGSLNYTELKKTVGIESTGTLNYHLKVLAEFLEKDDVGQYVLTEKGKFASRLLLELPERENQEQVKKKWWRRFWAMAIFVQVSALTLILALYLLGYVSFLRLIQGLVAFFFGILFVHFYYRMIRPPTDDQSQKNPRRTIADLFVSGRTLGEVKTELGRWIAEDGIIVEVERDDFIRGRLGVQSGLGLTAPKYFEITLKPDNNGVAVHTEGWISLFDVSEKSFSNGIFVSGNIPRRKGWKVMNHLWQHLREISK